MNAAPAMRKLLKSQGACVLNARPVVVAAFERFFAQERETFAAFARANPGAAFLLQLGWECETPENARRLGESVALFWEAAPGARVVVLCNAGAECAALENFGVETRWIQHNAFLDERRYWPLGGKERPFDAVYLARLTPFKRHDLLPEALAPRLLLIGASVYDVQREYAEAVRARYSAARWVRNFPGNRVSEYLSLAKCGLALSAAEGASFASAEYFLCGLPVVDTPALGGRDALYPPEFVRSVEASPEAVAEGIAHWASRRPDPRAVRAAWLAKAAVHRERYRLLMRELTGREPGRPPHKLGLRTPRPGSWVTLAIQARLRLKGLFSR